jgi:hypothetical protein
MGNRADEDRWLSAADSIRTAIRDKLYVADDAAFYDLDAQNRFVRIRSDVISRVLGEHVVDQKLFETIYRRLVHNPTAFWAPFPLPSIALDDPEFVRPIPQNSWGGASQALTALRAPRWMEHYGKPADLGYLMQKWIEAILRANAFLQQLDPLDGVFSPSQGGYSPTALVFLDFTWRLRGVRQAGDELEWNANPLPTNVSAKFHLRLSPTKNAELHYTYGTVHLKINGREFCRTSNQVRLITNDSGELKQAVGIAQQPTAVVIRQNSGQDRNFSIHPNESLNLSFVRM